MGSSSPSGNARSASHLENHDVVYAGHADRKLRIAALGDSTNARSWYARSRQSYRVGLPGQGPWLEVFNSDVYDHFVNPQVAGNGGAVNANGPPWHDMPMSAEIVIPANGVLVLARDAGD